MRVLATRLIPFLNQKEREGEADKVIFDLEME